MPGSWAVALPPTPPTGHLLRGDCRRSGACSHPPWPGAAPLTSSTIPLQPLSHSGPLGPAGPSVPPIATTTLLMPTMFCSGFPLVVSAHHRDQFKFQLNFRLNNLHIRLLLYRMIIVRVRTLFLCLSVLTSVFYVVTLNNLTT